MPCDEREFFSLAYGFKSEGAAHPAGPHAVDTLILAVLTRQVGEWRIKALENVTLTNPRTGEAMLRNDRGS